MEHRIVEGHDNRWRAIGWATLTGVLLTPVAAALWIGATIFLYVQAGGTISFWGEPAEEPASWFEPAIGCLAVAGAAIVVFAVVSVYRAQRDEVRYEPPVLSSLPPR